MSEQLTKATASVKYYAGAAQEAVGKAIGSETIQYMGEAIKLEGKIKQSKNHFLCTQKHEMIFPT